MSTDKNTPYNYDAPDTRIAGPSDESFAEDMSSSAGTVAIIGLVAVIAVIFFSALFANGLYRSQLKHTVQDQGVSDVTSKAHQAIAESQKRAEESDTANAGALLLEDTSSLAGTPAQQIAKDGDAADIPELPSYAAVLDPEAAAAAAAADEEEEESDDASEDDSDEGQDVEGEDADDEATDTDDGPENDEDGDEDEAASEQDDD